MTWPVLVFALTAVFALGFHLGQKLAVVEADSPGLRNGDELSGEPTLLMRPESARRSF